MKKLLNNLYVITFSLITLVIVFLDIADFYTVNEIIAVLWLAWAVFNCGLALYQEHKERP